MYLIALNSKRIMVLGSIAIYKSMFTLDIPHQRKRKKEKKNIEYTVIVIPNINFKVVV